MKSKLTLPVRSGQKLRFPEIHLPAFANEVDASEPIVGAFPNGGISKKHAGGVFFANDELIGSQHDLRLTNYLTGWHKAQFVNESYLTGTQYSQPLTNYVVGWVDPNNIEATVQFLAPQVNVVGRIAEFKAAVNYQEFLSEVVDDERAIGADFKLVTYSGSDQVVKTVNRGLSTIIDLDRVGTGIAAGSMGGAAPPPWQTSTVRKLTRRLWRNSARRALAAHSASAVQATTQSWTAQPVGSGIIPVNPDMQVQGELINATNVSGIRPNRVFYGDTAFYLRNLAFGSQNTPAGYLGYAPGASGNGMSANEMAVAAAIGVDRVYVSRERYQTSSTVKSEMVGSNVYMFYASDEVDLEDPSNVKRFVSQFNEEEGGGIFRVHVKELTAKLIAITVEFYEIIVVPYSGGMRKIPISAT